MHIGITGPIYLPSINIKYSGDRTTWPKGMGGVPVNHLINSLLELGHRISVFSSSTEVKIGDSFECIQQINKFNLQNSIKIVNPIKEISSYYLNSSIFLLSSEFEAFSLVLMEAKTFGIPCVSFDVETGPNEVIRDNIDGYLVPFPDCQIFAEKTIQLIENITLRKEMGNLARIDAISRFNPQEIYNKWDELLNTLPK